VDDSHGRRSARPGTALVTGASGGIGEQLARELAAIGYDLILVARTRNLLDALAAELSAAHGIRAQGWAEDLSDPAAPARLELRLRRSGPSRLTLLVNNAGVGHSGPFSINTVDQEAHMVMLNVFALNQLTRLLLPHLMANPNAGILNVASTAGLQPVPGMATYAATKAFVLSFSQALRDELAGTGVQVTTLCPGPTRTGFAAHAGAEGTRLFQSSNLASAAMVARAGLEGLARGKSVVIPGGKNRILALGGRFLPRGALIRASRRLMSAA
jgi:short-subunit dehydrogenase